MEAAAVAGAGDLYTLHTAIVTFEFQRAEPIYILIIGFAITFFLGTLSTKITILWKN